MKKITFTLIISLLFTKAFACSCTVPKPALEFYSAQYVFEGKVISKVYASDSLNYTVTFDISKHYKNGSKPKTLEFTFKSEGKYTGEWTSCDWNVNIDDTWLVYAEIYKDKLTFGYYCSNSKPLDNRVISESEQLVLENGNSFKIENYIYGYEHGFNDTKPITNVDSILKKGKIKKYEKPHSYLRLLINDKGLLQTVTINTNYYQVQRDSIFNLPKSLNTVNSKPLTEFQKDAIELVSQISKWEIMRHKDSNIAVNYIRGISISFDEKTGKWKYE